MRSVVIFSGNTPTGLGAGQKDDYFIAINTRGRLRKNSGGRQLLFGMIAGEDSYTLTCRYQPAMVGIKVNGKVTVDGVFFTIASIEKIDHVNHLIEYKLNVQVVS